MSKNANAVTGNREDIKSILTELFSNEKDGWEIPDDAIVGRFKNQFEQLKARVDSLTNELLAMKAKQNATTKEPEQTGRVDVSRLSKDGTKKK